MKDRCRKLFPDVARGGFDVYICFLKAGLDALPPGGRLGYIIPNKFLVAEYARPLREELLATTTIEEVIDVSDLPTFRDAAVYPVMLVLRKTPPPPGHRIRTGYVTDLAQLDSGLFARSEVLQSRWAENPRQVCWLPPADAVERGLLDRLLGDKCAQPLSQYLEFRWAISFHRAGLRDQFIFPEPTGRSRAACWGENGSMATPTCAVTARNGAAGGSIMTRNGRAPRGTSFRPRHCSTVRSCLLRKMLAASSPPLIVKISLARIPLLLVGNGMMCRWNTFSVC